MDDLAVRVAFLDRDMRHRRRGRGPVPMLHTGRTPDHIAGPDFLDRATPTRRPAKAGGHDQRLTEGMRVPRGPGARLEGDAAAGHTGRIGRLEQGVNAYLPGEILGRPLGGGL